MNRSPRNQKPPTLKSLPVKSSPSKKRAGCGAPSTEPKVRHLEVQVCSIDYYLTPTTFNTARRTFGVNHDVQLPVIRIFGPNPAGQKCCLHIHGVFPYFFVGIPNALALEYTRNARNPKGLTLFASELKQALEQSMVAAHGRFAEKQTRFVHSTEVVAGRSFYGYHTAKQVFVKISVFNPTDVRRLAHQLQLGQVLGRSFQTYESHVPYLLQFFVDHDVSGMGNVTLEFAVPREAPSSRKDGRDRFGLNWESTRCAGLPLRSVPPANPAVAWPSSSSSSSSSSASTSQSPRKTSSGVPTQLLPTTVERQRTSTGDSITKLYKVSWCDVEADSAAPFIVREDFGPLQATPDGKSAFQYIPSLKLFWRQNEILRREYGLEAAVLPTLSATPKRTQTDHGSRYLNHFKNYLRARQRETEQRQPTQFPANRSNADDIRPQPNTCALARSHSMDSQCSTTSSSSQFGNSMETSQYSQEELDCVALLESMYDPAVGIASVQPGPSHAGDERAADPTRSSPTIIDDKHVESQPSIDSGLDACEQLRLLCTPLSQLQPGQLSNGRSSTVRSCLDCRLVSQDNDGDGQSNSDESDEELWNDVATATQQHWQASDSCSDAGELGSVDDQTSDLLYAGTGDRKYLEPLLSQGDDRSGGAAHKLHIRRCSSNPTLVFVPRDSPPSASALFASLGRHGLQHVVDPILQNSSHDVPPSVVQSKLRQFSPALVDGHDSLQVDDGRTPGTALLYAPGLCCFEPTFGPPRPLDLFCHAPTQRKTSIRFELEDTPSFIPAAQDTSTLPKEARDCVNAAVRAAAESGRATRRRYTHYTKMSSTLCGESESTDALSSLIQSPSTMGSDDSLPAGSRSKRKLKTSHGFKHSSIKPLSQHLLTMSVEVLCETKGGRLPDPASDGILAICYCFSKTVEKPACWTQGVIVQSRVCGSEQNDRPIGWICNNFDVQKTDSEHSLIQAFVNLVRTRDPDLIVGWEVQRSSLGFILKRASQIFEEDFHLDRELSRLFPTQPGDARHYNDEWGAKTGSDIHLVGREVFNVWRLMRGELTLSSYTLQNVAWETLRKRIPFFKPPVLHYWLTRCTQPAARERALEHGVRIASYTLRILEHLDFINRTSEFARMYGIDLMSVTTRGSQFRVEAVMLRILRRMAEQDDESFILLSPSREQVAHQRALEVIAMNLEPESAVYTAPVAVLDYQSLYPSIIISHNICFSTCLGRMTKPFPDNDADASSYFRSRLGVLESYSHSDHAIDGLDVERLPPFISDNGVAFVSAEQREGVLPRMLREILTMRVLVKDTLKAARARNDKVMVRILDSRQLGLKLLANVTYGYTAASFSGRMPCVEIADAIVQTGRTILSDTIRHAEANWRAKVVYGDTDSIFVHLPGQTLAGAFRVGAEIADACTGRHPYPVKLKLEKVYQPAILITKKRYAGYMYETAPMPGAQAPAVLDMKGVHAVRRDGFPALVKIMKRVLHILFQTLDLGTVRSYVERQCRKILNGTVSAQDLIFRKEVKMNYRVRPPHAVVAAKMALRDPMAMPLYGQRVPYVIVYGSQNARVLDLAMPPDEVLDCNFGESKPQDNATHIDEKEETPNFVTSKPNSSTHAVTSILDIAKQFWKERGNEPTAPQRRLSAQKQSDSSQKSFRQKYILNGRFYVNRITKALDSILKLCGQGNGIVVDCNAWTRRLAQEVVIRNRRFNFGASSEQLHGTHQGATLDSYFESHNCANCFAQTSLLFCEECRSHPQSLRANVMLRLANSERSAALLASRCSACADYRASTTIGDHGTEFGGMRCSSLDCPALYARRRALNQLRFASLSSSALDTSFAEE